MATNLEMYVSSLTMGFFGIPQCTQQIDAPLSLFRRKVKSCPFKSDVYSRSMNLFMSFNIFFFVLPLDSGVH